MLRVAISHRQEEFILWGYTINQFFTMCMTITWGSCYTMDSNSTYKWGMRLCISNRLLGAAAAAQMGTAS